MDGYPYYDNEYFPPSNKRAWNSGVKHRTNISVFVPYSLFYKIGKINEKVEEKIGENYEFSVILSGEWEGLSFILTDKIFIPAQEVEFSSVDFKKKALPKGDMWNAIIHKHPSGVVNFSDSDIETLSKNFDVSMLFLNGAITLATARANINGEYYLFLDNQVEVIVEAPEIDVQVPDISPIQKKTYITSGFFSNKNIKFGKGKKNPVFDEDLLNFLE